MISFGKIGHICPVEDCNRIFHKDQFSEFFKHVWGHSSEERASVDEPIAFYRCAYCACCFNGDDHEKQFQAHINKWHLANRPRITTQLDEETGVYSFLFKACVSYQTIYNRHSQNKSFSSKSCFLCDEAINDPGDLVLHLEQNHKTADEFDAQAQNSSVSNSRTHDEETTNYVTDSDSTTPEAAAAAHMENTQSRSMDIWMDRITNPDLVVSEKVPFERCFYCGYAFYSQNSRTIFIEHTIEWHLKQRVTVLASNVKHDDTSRVYSLKPNFLTKTTTILYNVTFRSDEPGLVEVRPLPFNHCFCKGCNYEADSLSRFWDHIDRHRQKNHRISDHPAKRAHRE